MDTRLSSRRVDGFIREFGIDMGQFITPQEGWRSFNDFFSRALAPGARPVESDLVLPADGRHSAYPDGADLSGLVVKGRPFTLEELFADRELARRFEGGALVVSRLCPTDYHRFHFPASGMPSGVQKLRGPLDSVSPVAIRAGARSLCANRRELTMLKTARFGTVAIIEVGASCVGRIVQTFRPGGVVEAGAQKGYFQFGASTAITVFEPGRVTLCEDLVRNTAEGFETYARMGGRMGRAVG
jgi:phosphatidylserine decarboxylase